MKYSIYISISTPCFNPERIMHACVYVNGLRFGERVKCSLDIGGEEKCKEALYRLLCTSLVEHVLEMHRPEEG
jgi:hypothetical protein